MKDKILIGSRESRLAVIQSEMVLQYIQQANPGLDVEILTMKTSGDKNLTRPLFEIGGKGLFVKELDAALLSGRSDLSVHSLKDVPMELPKELPLIAFSAREDARDALILPEGMNDLDFSKPVGCSSRRRMLQFSALYPQATFAPIRGNVQTRLQKLDSGEYCATILAVAGLKRLGLQHRVSRYFSTEEMIPAAGQGILAVQGRKGEDYRYLDGYNDGDAAICAQAERAFVRALGGNCSTPVAAYARIVPECEAHGRVDLPASLSGEYYINMSSGARNHENGKDLALASSSAPIHVGNGRVLRLDAFYYDEKTGNSFRGSETGDIENPGLTGEKLADRFRKRQVSVIGEKPSGTGE